MPKLAGDLGPLERAIMEQIWDRPGDEVSVRDVLETAAGRHNAYTTFMTVLERLWRKGFLSRRQVGRAYVYRARITREAHIEHLVTQVLAGTPDRRSAILGFVRSVDEDDLDELRKAIRRVERERRSDR
jgi:predicted transcriptional regulator